MKTTRRPVARAAAASRSSSVRMRMSSFFLFSQIRSASAVQAASEWHACAAGQ